VGSPSELDQAVENLAWRMKDLFIDARLLGQDGAAARIRGWLSNFDGLLAAEDQWPLVDVLRSITILWDKQILNDSIEFLRAHCDLDHRWHKFTCLGSAYESSARIIRLLNHDASYSPSLEDLRIDRGALRGKEPPLIIFVDDFLNSGGQFAAILQAWSGGGEAPVDSRARAALSPAALDRLKRAQLLFVFHHGMAEGRLRAERHIKENGLNAAVHCLYTYQDTVGIFGNREDLGAIRDRLPGTVSEASIFRGREYRALAPFLDVCEQAGKALLKRAKPDWPEPRYGDRCLGYGNSAKLYLTEVNVPTCTLTCLWQGGRIEIGGRTIDWQPLAQRHGKKGAGVEGGSAPSGSPTVVEDAERLLDVTTLDFGQARSAPFEVTLFVPATTVTTPPGERWSESRPGEDQGTLGFTGLLDPAVRACLGLEPEPRRSPRTRVWVLGGRGLSSMNRHLDCVCGERRHPLKVVTAHWTSFGDLVAYVGLRLQLPEGPFSLREAVNLVYRLTFLDDSAARNAPLVQRRAPTAGSRPRLTTSVPQLLRWLEEATGEGPMTDPFSPVAGRHAWQRAQALVFLRAGGGLFDRSPEVIEALVKVAASFTRPGVDATRRRVNVSHFPLDLDAHVGLGDRGAVVLCGDRPTVNAGFLSPYFHQHYYFLFVFAQHIEDVCRRLRLPAATDEAWTERARAWLGRLRTFPFGNACQRPHMNEFLQELERRLRLRERIDETLRMLRG
jgi:hypothetical protein